MEQRTMGVADVDAAAGRTFVNAAGLPAALLPLVLVILTVVGAIEGWPIALAVAAGTAVGIGLVVLVFGWSRARRPSPRR